MTKRRIFTANFKAQVVLELLSGSKSTAEACREYNLQSQVLNRWKAQFLDQAHTIFETDPAQNQEQPRLAELERMVGRLTMEVEAAKKASALSTSLLKPNGR
jgi:transposase-like protein